MKTIYLDYNVMIIVMENRNPALKKLVYALKKDFIFPYSPAHMEEMAVPNMRSGNDKVKLKNKLRFIEDLSKKYEFFPSSGTGKTLLKREKPKACYERVITYYRLNDFIEENEEQMLKDYKLRDPNGDLSSSASNKGVDILFNDIYDNELIGRMLSDEGLSNEYGRKLNSDDIKSLKSNFYEKPHGVKERVLELVFNYLEYIRYKPEKVKKSRSRMHDCTHAIYASNANAFVSDDAKFLSKVKAVYNYLSIETEVLSTSEFLETFSTVSA